MTRVQRIELFGALGGIVVGTLLHFSYAWFGRQFFIGLFSAINESVWEHTKMLVTPIILYSFIEWHFLRATKRIIFAKAVELFVTVLFIIAFFYTYTGALGIKEILAVDIVSFFVAVLVGKYVSYRILANERTIGKTRTFISAMLVIVVVILEITFTIAPPAFPLFTEDKPVAAVVTTNDIPNNAQQAVGIAYPEFKDFTASQGFAGREIRTVVDGTDNYFAYLTMGSGVPIVEAACFRVDRLLRVYKVGDFPDPLDSLAGYTDVDPKNCRGLNPPQ